TSDAVFRVGDGEEARRVLPLRVLEEDLLGGGRVGEVGAADFHLVLLDELRRLRRLLGRRGRRLGGVFFGLVGRKKRAGGQHGRCEKNSFHGGLLPIDVVALYGGEV